jgi:hypothetical protein
MVRLSLYVGVELEAGVVGFILTDEEDYLEAVDDCPGVTSIAEPSLGEVDPPGACAWPSHWLPDGRAPALRSTTGD